MNIRRKLAVVIVALGSVSVAQADPTLVEGQCDGTANAAVTCDTATGLEWLDLTATAGLSVNDFLADEGGWLSQGWSVADRTQVYNLYINAGFSIVGGTFNFKDVEPALLMLDLLGCTSFSCVGSGRFGQGYTVSPGGDLVYVSFYQVSGNPADSGIARFNSQSVPPSLSTPFEGVWAVRASVPEPVAIDIKPGSCPNSLNCKSKGVLPVAILGTAEFDVNEIDPATVRLAGVAPLRWDFEDVATPYEPFTGKQDCTIDCTEMGPDGYLDATLKFDTQEVIAALGEAVLDGACLVAQLTGNLRESFGGTEIVGEDVIRINCKGK